MPGQPDFEIKSQVADDVYDPATNTVVRVMRVTFYDPVTLVTDSVDVPLSQYDRESALTLIAERLRKIRAVHSLDTLPAA